MYFTESRECAICEELEYKESDLIVSKFWICPKCISKLRDFITPSKDDEINNYN